VHASRQHLAENVAEQPKRHVHDVDTGRGLEHLPGEVRRAADSGGTEIELPRFCFASAIRSLTDLTCSVGATTSTLGIDAISVTDAKSLNGW